ncbi:methylated-DNA--[protein]-cysteine S-methyltransferase, partial [Bavariicoccus seileri]|uniref:methylated-DNA--[protein]-cysteine S-methyltransferase n=1 Tax=Bavariicoccus seileri TaxID=549685 RepID=UPI003F93AC63
TSKIMLLVKAQLKDYFTGHSTAFDVPLRLTGTAFQKSVWQQLLKIPYGKAASYLDMARQLGDPHLVRAIGGANRANKIAIIIPCHRVITSSGTIGGYSGGVERKRWLLELEGSL